MLETKTISNQPKLNVISQKQFDSYEHDGYLILENFIESNVCDLLIKQAKCLIDAYNPAGIKNIFSSRDENNSKQNYFLESGDKIQFFFEEDAFHADGTLKRDKQLSINKIGHALHELDPVFSCFSKTHKLAMLMQDLGVDDPLIVQSMYICKQPYIGGEVLPHQDSTYLYTQQKPVIGLWFALEEATIENGCLWALPGFHQTLKSRMIRHANNQVEMVTYDKNAWPIDEMVPLAVPAGSLIVLHGRLPHMSKENKSARSRHAYTLHVVSEKAGYAEDNWLYRRSFRGFL